MNLDSSRKRRMWVLPLPSGTINIQERAQVVIEYAFFRLHRLLGEVTAFFVAPRKKTVFPSNMKDRSFQFLGLPNVFISEKEIR
jgi:hypothetical protein